MALDAQQAQELLDKHQVDGTAIGGFAVLSHRPDQDPALKNTLVGYGLAFAFAVLGPESPLALVPFVAIMAASVLWSSKDKGRPGVGRRLVIVTNLGLAVAKPELGLTAERVSSWDARPEAEIRYELDPLQVQKGEDTVALTVGDTPYFAFGSERDAAFRLYQRQPTRWSGLTDRA